MTTDSKNRPPKAGERILGWFVPDSERSYLLGDHEEVYAEYCSEKSKIFALAWFWCQIIKIIISFFVNNFIWSLYMFRNYLKIALRNVKRNKGYSSINIVGLAFGLAISLVLSFYVLHDLTFDRFHENTENIYRILSGKKDGTRVAITSGPLVEKVGEDIPEILASARANSTRYNVKRADGITAGADAEEGVMAQVLLTDPGFFDIFSFKIISGESAEALEVNGSVFLTQDFASTLFGDENPVGKPLNIDRLENAYVAGIVEKPSNRSHIQYDMIAPINVESNPVWWNSWENLGLIGYVRLRDNADVDFVVDKMVEIGKANNLWEIVEPRLQPLIDIHLGSMNIAYDFINTGKNESIVVIALGAIGIIVLLIACINFVNLSTARATKRAREVGIRKVVGSSRIQLSSQFIGESVMFTVISFLFALVIVAAVSPYLNSILNKELNLNLLENIPVLAVMSGITLVLGIISGIYPAIVLSSFNPVDVVKGEFQTGASGVIMRKALIVFQFALTISLLAGVLIIRAQIDYLKSLDLGYSRENVIAVGGLFQDGTDIGKQKLSDFPGISSMGRINALPGSGVARYQIIPEGSSRERGVSASNIYVDEELFETLEIRLAKGRNFSKEFTTDRENAVIINKTLAENTEWEDPIGKQLDIVDEEGQAIPYTVIGVTGNFHYMPTKSKPRPMIFRLNPARSFWLVAKVSEKQTAGLIARLEEIYSEEYPERNLNYLFLDDRFDMQFDNDRSFAANIGIFSLIAILIACLGLIGLASHTIEQRQKEMVIRKILGCGGRRIVYLLTSDFLKWILIANLFAWPFAYFVMSRWMNEFAYKMPFDVTPYVIAGSGSVLIAFLTILYQTIKVARSNPVDALKYE